MTPGEWLGLSLVLAGLYMVVHGGVLKITDLVWKITDLVWRHDSAMLEVTLRSQRSLHEHLDVVESTVVHVIDALKPKPEIHWYAPCGYNAPPRTHG